MEFFSETWCAWIAAIGLGIVGANVITAVVKWVADAVAKGKPQ